MLFFTYVLLTLLMLVGLFLWVIVLLQKGRGGGLAGALGGMGGQSAFGTKAGDTFTWVTYGAAILWIIVACGTGALMEYAAAYSKGSGLTPQSTEPAVPTVDQTKDEDDEAAGEKSEKDKAAGDKKPDDKKPDDKKPDDKSNGEPAGDSMPTEDKPDEKKAEDKAEATGDEKTAAGTNPAEDKTTPESKPADAKSADEPAKAASEPAAEPKSDPATPAPENQPTEEKPAETAPNP